MRPTVKMISSVWEGDLKRKQERDVAKDTNYMPGKRGDNQDPEVRKQ